MRDYIRREPEGTPSFLEVAKFHPVTFRGILRHMVTSGDYQINSVDPEVPLDELLADIHPDKGHDFFVADFTVGRQDTRLVHIADAFLEHSVDAQTALIAAGTMVGGFSGWGIIDSYHVAENGEPEFMSNVISIGS